MIHETMERLATCLCAQLTEEGRPACFCGVVPGDAVVADYAGDCEGDDCGIAWVRLITAYPASGIGVANTEAGNCGSEIGIDLEVGILRCIEVTAEAPSQAQLLTYTQDQTDDAESIIRAIACCPEFSRKDFIIDGYAPMGPMGGYAGGAWTVRMVATP